MDLTHLIAIAAALGWASGPRLYAVVFVLFRVMRSLATRVGGRAPAELAGGGP
jgi:hypothetical protein